MDLRNSFWILIFSCLFSNISAAKEEDILFLRYKKRCNDDRTLIEAVQNAGIVNSEDLVDLEENYLSLLQQRNPEGSRRRRLSRMTWQERADEIAALMDAFSIVLKKSDQLQDTAEVSSVLVERLEHLEIDFIDSADDARLIQLALTMPCIVRPIERNELLSDQSPENILSADGNADRRKKRNLSSAPELDDPEFGRQWYLRADVPGGMNVLKAWECYNGEDGKTPTVAVFDTGIKRHPDLERSLRKSVRAKSGFDAAFSDEAYPATLVHGTAVASLIAATPNDGFGIAGVVWNGQIMPVKLTSADGKSYRSSRLLAINHVLKHKIKISTHSYGSFSEFSDLEQHAYTKLDKADHLTLFIAHNHGCDIDSTINAECEPSDGTSTARMYPAVYEMKNSIVVGASDQQGHRAEFSNYGKKTVHIFAPGVRIVGADFKLNVCDVQTLFGTSLSVPLVAGVAALLRGLNPKLTAAQTKELILSTAKPITELKDFCVTGGIVDASAAITKLSRTYRKTCIKPSWPKPTPLDVTWCQSKPPSPSSWAPRWFVRAKFYWKLYWCKAMSKLHMNSLFTALFNKTLRYEEALLDDGISCSLSMNR